MKITPCENLNLDSSQVGPFDSPFDCLSGVLLQDSVCIPKAHHKEFAYPPLSPSESPLLHGSIKSSCVNWRLP